MVQNSSWFMPRRLRISRGLTSSRTFIAIPDLPQKWTMSCQQHGACQLPEKGAPGGVQSLLPWRFCDKIQRLFSNPDMALIVQKFGGTSVGTTERIGNVAQRVAKFRTQGHQLVVVVSAISGETNRLLGLAKESVGFPTDRRNHDNELVALCAEFGNPLRNVPDPLGCSYGRSTEFLDDQRHVRVRKKSLNFIAKSPRE